MTYFELEKTTRKCVLTKGNNFLGYEGENLVNNLVFEFKDGFMDGIALLHIKRGEQLGYVELDKVDETYQFPVKNSMLSEVGYIDFQLVITAIDGTVIKFNPFSMYVKDAIDTDAEMPEEYPSWIDEANAKIAEMDKAIEDAEKLDAKVEQTQNGALITITGRDGVTTAEVLHGTGEGTGGGIVAETDPIYNKDKPNIALKSEIPTNLSQLKNDSDFATETYVDEEIAKFDFIKVVDALPSTGLPNRIYFVPKTDTDTQDLFDEYAWINDKWEWITTKQIEVDMTKYVTKDDLLELIESGGLGGKYSETELLSSPATYSMGTTTTNLNEDLALSDDVNNYNMLMICSDLYYKSGSSYMHPSNHIVLVSDIIYNDTDSLDKNGSRFNIVICDHKNQYALGCWFKTGNRMRMLNTASSQTTADMTQFRIKSIKGIKF